MQGAKEIIAKQETKMKIDIHSETMYMMSREFYDSISHFSNQLCNTMPAGCKIKVVQLYSDYCLPDGSYPFRDEEFLFYPLTLIYNNSQWKIHWIKWLRSDLSPRATSPWHTDKQVSIISCSDVNDEFNRFLEHKQPFFVQEKKFATPRAGAWGYKCTGKINTSFVDELSRQISRQLMTLSGTNLSPDWELCMEDISYTTQIIDDIKYRPVCLKKNAYSITFGVAWKENFDVCDWVNSNDINFFLTDRLFHPHVSPLAKVVEFIHNNTLMTTIRTSTFNASVCNYPDVIFTLKLKPSQHNLTTATQILRCAELFVHDYNCGDTEEKIHDIFLLNYNVEEPVQLCVDFGNCDVEVLQAMIEYLRVQVKQLLKANV